MMDAEPIPIVAPAPEAPPAETRTLEPGLGAFLFSGGPAGAYAGGSASVVAELSDAVALRPSLAYGTSLADHVRSTIAIARFSYVFAGTDVGTPASGRTLPYIDFGPSVGLRGEIGRFAVTLRGIGGFAVARDGFDDITGTRVIPELFTLRWEIVFSWDVRG